MSNFELAAPPQIEGEALFSRKRTCRRQIRRLRISPGKKMKAQTPQTWAKLNVDRQILAIAAVRRVDAIYSIDSDVHRLASQVGIQSVGLEGLPLPPPVQLVLKEDAPSAQADKVVRINEATEKASDNSEAASEPSTATGA